MRTTHWMTLALLAATISAAPGAVAENCNNTNYGVQANTYVIADCSGDTFTYYQHCHQETGAGVGAGSGAVGVGPDSDAEAAAAAEGTAGTNCNQASGNGTDPRTIDPPETDGAVAALLETVSDAGDDDVIPEPALLGELSQVVDERLERTESKLEDVLQPVTELLT